MGNIGFLTIGKLAREGGVNIQTIRYYERRGLIPKPKTVLRRDIASTMTRPSSDWALFVRLNY